MKTRISRVIAVILVVAVSGMLQACKKADETDFDAPTISITSPKPGTDIAISQNISLKGSVSNDVASVKVENDDGSTVYANLVDTSYTASVMLHNNKNTLKVTATDHAGNYTSISFNLYFPVLNLSFGGLNATVHVIGQNSFDTNAINQGLTINNNTLSGVAGTLFERNNATLYIPDSGNNRILGFDSLPVSNNAPANFILGQADRYSAVSGTEANRFNAPAGVFVTSSQLFVADTGNNRVLIWDSIPRNDSTNADHVIGWTDMMSATTGCSATTLSSPTSVFVVNNKVVVLDQANNRVLIWGSIPASDGATATIVLGQSKLSATPMDVCAPNDTNGDGTGDGTPDRSTFNNPGGLWTDGTRLLVADTGNNRVLVWDTFPINNGQDADHIIGQYSVAGELSRNGLHTPTSVTSNGNQIIVADSDNHRVLIWNAFPTSDKPDADNVIGQDSYITNTPMIGQYTFEFPNNVFVDHSNLYVIDGNRILKFSNP